MTRNAPKCSVERYFQEKINQKSREVEGQSTLQNMRIGKRLAMSYGRLVALLLCLAGLGYLGVSTISGATMHMLAGDSNIAEQAGVMLHLKEEGPGKGDGVEQDLLKAS